SATTDSEHRSGNKTPPDFHHLTCSSPESPAIAFARHSARQETNKSSDPSFSRCSSLSPDSVSPSSPVALSHRQRLAPHSDCSSSSARSFQQFHRAVLPKRPLAQRRDS